MTAHRPLRAGSARRTLRSVALAAAALLPVAAPAMPLANGGFVTGTIALEGQTDAWTLDVAPGEHVTLRIADTTSNPFTPRIQLFDTAGLLIAEDAGDDVATVEWASTQLGELTVLVSDGDAGGFDAGSYALWLARIPGAASSGALVEDVVHAGSITLGELDTFTLAVSAGERLVLRIAETAGSNFRPHLDLHDPSGARVASDRSGRGSRSVGTIEHEAASDGLYTLLVRDDRFGDNAHDSGTGDYAIRLARIPGSDERGTLSPGTSVSDAIALGDLDTWVFDAPPGADVGLVVTETTGTNFVPRVEVYGPDGALLGFARSGSVAALDVQTTRAGTHTVLVRDDRFGDTGGDNGTGTYDLLLTLSAPPVPLPGWLAGAAAAGLLAAGRRRGGGGGGRSGDDPSSPAGPRAARRAPRRAAPRAGRPCAGRLCLRGFSGRLEG